MWAVRSKNKICNCYVVLQKPVSFWEMHRLWSGQLFTATMVSASCLGTTELKSCTGAAHASKMPFVGEWPECEDTVGGLYMKRHIG